MRTSASKGIDRMLSSNSKVKSNPFKQLSSTLGPNTSSTAIVQEGFRTKIFAADPKENILEAIVSTKRLPVLAAEQLNHHGTVDRIRETEGDRCPRLQETRIAAPSKFQKTEVRSENAVKVVAVSMPSG